MRRAAAMVLMAAGLAGAAAAATPVPRSPAQRQILLDLAYALGEVHALRAVCQGPQDQSWRARMTRMIEVEQPDEAFRRRLIDGFNAGFVTRQAGTPVCGADTPAQERALAARGRALAQRLAGRP
jgi:uncharacterized protein (TIGR02301 family)